MSLFICLLWMWWSSEYMCSPLNPSPLTCPHIFKRGDGGEGGGEKGKVGESGNSAPPLILHFSFGYHPRLKLVNKTSHVKCKEHKQYPKIFQILQLICDLITFNLYPQNWNIWLRAFLILGTNKSSPSLKIHVWKRFYFLL